MQTMCVIIAAASQMRRVLFIDPPPAEVRPARRSKMYRRHAPDPRVERVPAEVRIEGLTDREADYAWRRRRPTTANPARPSNAALPGVGTAAVRTRNSSNVEPLVHRVKLIRRRLLVIFSLSLPGFISRPSLKWLSRQ